ncbi:hypothetical protein GBA52_004815 [Prunus armeniaca]|nr:hypothetical protein GBA52_004815 [Prunus armeniaca]
MPAALYYYFTTTILLVLLSSTNAATRHSQYLSQANQFLAPQNAARSATKMKPLVWDAKLARVDAGSGSDGMGFGEQVVQLLV